MINDVEVLFYETIDENIFTLKLLTDNTENLEPFLNDI